MEDGGINTVIRDPLKWITVSTAVGATLSTVYYAGYFSILDIRLLLVVSTHDLIVSAFFAVGAVAPTLGGFVTGYADLIIDRTPEDIRTSFKYDPVGAVTSRLSKRVMNIYRAVGMFGMLLPLIPIFTVWHILPELYYLMFGIVSIMYFPIIISLDRAHILFQIVLIVIILSSSVFYYGRYHGNREISHSSGGYVTKGEIVYKCKTFFVGSSAYVCVNNDGFTIEAPYGLTITSKSVEK